MPTVFRRRVGKRCNSVGNALFVVHMAAQRVARLVHTEAARGDGAAPAGRYERAPLPRAAGAASVPGAAFGLR